MDDDLTPTQKIWLPISQLERQHNQAFRDLHAAMKDENFEAARRAYERITQIEKDQAGNHAAARQYIFRKLQLRNSSQDAPFRPETGLNFNGEA